MEGKARYKNTKKESETTSYLQSLMLGQVSGPRVRAITKTLPRGTPPGTRMQAKVSLQHLSLDLVRCHSTSRAYSSKQIFPFKTGQKKPASCTLEEHLTLQAPREHDTTFHVQSSTSSLKKKWNRCFRSVVHCGQLIV